MRPIKVKPKEKRKKELLFKKKQKKGNVQVNIKS